MNGNGQETAIVEARPVETETAIQASPTTGQLMQLAINKGADIAYLRELLALKREEEANEARKAFTAAMSRFREKCPPIIKSRTVDFTSSKGRTCYTHAGLCETVEQIKTVLAECGLSHTWKTQQNNGDVSVTCIVTHAMGHSESTTLHGPTDQSGNKNAIQAIGSAVTYLQRYTLFAILGLASQDQDDDGGGAGNGNGHDAPPTKSQSVLDEDEKKARIEFASLCVEKTAQKNLPKAAYVNLLAEVKRQSGNDSVADCTAWLRGKGLKWDGKTLTIVEPSKGDAEELIGPPWPEELR